MGVGYAISIAYAQSIGATERITARIERRTEVDHNRLSRTRIAHTLIDNNSIGSATELELLDHIDTVYVVGSIWIFLDCCAYTELADILEFDA
jgi:hypothetical protein